MGVTILQDSELLHYWVKNLRKKKHTSELLKKTSKIIPSLINHYSPQILVIEKTFFGNNKNTVSLVMVAKEVKTVAKRKGLRVCEYAPKTIRKAICKSGKAVKREVAEVICVRYPELYIYLTQDRKWKEKYWQNCFDGCGIRIHPPFHKAIVY